MRIAITGSSGLIGTVLVEELHRRHEITGYDRRPRATLPQVVRFVQGDMEDPQTLAQALEGAEGVIHLAAIPYDIPPLHEVFRFGGNPVNMAQGLAVLEVLNEGLGKFEQERLTSGGAL